MIEGVKSFDGLNITFQVTEDCNLRCTYCYEVGKRPGTLKIEDAKKFIDLLLEDKDPIGVDGTEADWILNTGLILDFIGGDALMVPELCDEILTYFIFRAKILKHKWQDNWRASISTNGTLFDRQNVRDFLEKYSGNLNIGVSLDGCPEIHDKNRVFVDGSGTMAVIQRNWAWFCDYAARSGVYITTKATLNKESIPYIAESVRFLHEDMNLKYIAMNFIFEDMGLVDADYIKIDEQMSLVTDYVLEHRHDLHFSMLDSNRAIGHPALPETMDKGFCGSGSMPCLTVGGSIYPCFRFTPITMVQGSDFSVGNTVTGFSKKENFERVRACTRGKISDPTCLSCPIESACSWCIGGYVSCHGTTGRGTYLCKIVQICDKYARKYWNSFYELEHTHEARHKDVDYSSCLIK
jgi:uncharacterized protein